MNDPTLIYLFSGFVGVLLIALIIALVPKKEKVVIVKDEPKMSSMDEALALMQKDLEKKEQEVNTNSKYEDEQEETAIISYKELANAKEEQVVETPKFNSVSEYFDYVNEHNQKAKVEEPVKEKVTDNKYLKEEEFLRNLKEFRKNL